MEGVVDSAVGEEIRCRSSISLSEAVGEATERKEVISFRLRGVLVAGMGEVGKMLNWVDDSATNSFIFSIVLVEDYLLANGSTGMVRSNTRQIFSVGGLNEARSGPRRCAP